MIVTLICVREDWYVCLCTFLSPLPTAQSLTHFGLTYSAVLLILLNH